MIPNAEELVALGAAVQAAAVCTGRSLTEVATAWELGGGTSIDPERGVDAAAIREAYAYAVTEARSHDD